MNKETTNTTLEQAELLYNTQKESGVSSIVNKGARYFTGYLLYILGIACILFIFIMNNVMPFHVLSKIEHTEQVITAIGSRGDAQAFAVAVKALVGIIGLLLILLGSHQIKLIRKRNDQSNALNSLKQCIDELKQFQVKPAAIASKLENGATLKEVEPKDFPLD
jgi:hypothetical protein